MSLARNLKVESISRLSPRAPVLIDADRPITDAVALMRAENVGCLMVMRNGQLVGVFTERDLLTRVLAAGKPLSGPVADGMTPDPVTVRLSDPIRLAVRRMVQGGYRHLPVSDANDRPVGVLSIRRIVHYLVEHFPSTVYNQPPDPSAVPQQPEGG